MSQPQEENIKLFENLVKMNVLENIYSYLCRYLCKIVSTKSLIKSRLHDAYFFWGKPIIYHRVEYRVINTESPRF